MGRELRRKEAKRNGKNVKEAVGYENLDSGINKSTTLKIVVFVVAALVLLYLIIAIFITKELDFTRDKDEEVSEEDSNNSVSNSILAVSTFNQSEEEYYVLFYGFNDTEAKDVVSGVSNKLSGNKVYRVDIDSGMNKNYVSDISNPNVTSINDLKVSGITLMRITGDSVSLYLDGKDAINGFING